MMKECMMASVTPQQDVQTKNPSIASSARPTTGVGRNNARMGMSPIDTATMPAFIIGSHSFARPVHRSRPSWSAD